MKNEEIGQIVFLTIIASRKQKDDLLSALSNAGIPMTNIIYGKGTVNASYLQNALGLVPEENKAVLTCLLQSEKSVSILKMLIDDFHFNNPNTGIAFTIPINQLSF